MLAENLISKGIIGDSTSLITKGYISTVVIDVYIEEPDLGGPSAGTLEYKKIYRSKIKKEEEEEINLVIVIHNTKYIFSDKPDNKIEVVVKNVINEIKQQYPKITIKNLEIKCNE